MAKTAVCLAYKLMLMTLGEGHLAMNKEKKKHSKVVGGHEPPPSSDVQKVALSKMTPISSQRRLLFQLPPLLASKCLAFGIWACLDASDAETALTTEVERPN